MYKNYIYFVQCSNIPCPVLRSPKHIGSITHSIWAMIERNRQQFQSLVEKKKHEEWKSSTLYKLQMGNQMWSSKMKEPKISNELPREKKCNGCVVCSNAVGVVLNAFYELKEHTFIVWILNIEYIYQMWEFGVLCIFSLFVRFIFRLVFFSSPFIHREISLGFYASHSFRYILSFAWAENAYNVVYNGFNSFSTI